MSETHHIWTEDGYCLDVHRVLPPNGYENSCRDLRENIEVQDDTKAAEVNYVMTDLFEYDEVVNWRVRPV